MSTMSDRDSGIGVDGCREMVGGVAEIVTMTVVVVVDESSDLARTEPTW